MKRQAYIAAAVVAICAQALAFSDGLDVLKRVNPDTIIKAGKGIEAASTSIANIAEEITPEQQYYIGRAVAGTVLENYRLYQNKAATAYANRICAAITQASDMPVLYKGYYVGILDTDEVNAISTPGGHILITRGLMECAHDEDALAAVIAHEVAHIQLGHSVKAIRSSRATNELIKATQAGSGSSSQLLEGFKDSVDDIVNQVVTSGYSKTQEFQADKKSKD